jgi:prevent-host-death family protein
VPYYGFFASLQTGAYLVILVIMTNTREIAVADLKARLSEVLRDVERGESVVVTRHGKPVIGLVSAEDLALLGRIRAAGADQGLAGLAGSWKGARRLLEALGGE